MSSSTLPVSTASSTGPPLDFEHRAANVRICLETLLDVRPGGPDALVKTWNAEVLSISVSKLISNKLTAFMILQGIAFNSLRDASTAGERFLVPSVVLSASIEYSIARGSLDSFDPARIQKDDPRVLDNPWYQPGVPSRPVTPDVGENNLQDCRGM
jgi:hypothetical protein